MSGAIVAGAAIGAAASYMSAEKGAEGAEGAAETSAAAQRESLDYLKEVEAAPRHYREKALGQMAGFYGIPGFEGAEGMDEAAFIESVKQSPFYGSMISEGEEAVGRNLSMTGNLRSGTAKEALAMSSQGVLQDLVNQRLQGISGMASLPSYAKDIADVQTGIGETQAAGMLGASRAQQQGYQGIGEAVTGGIEAWNKRTI